ncbi:Fur family transcriptional regulator [Demequina aurantiaca]|uniref:Fur family transcriptional regulator n=1 Tax=Demequina aurantiaca TaxID=676200 RepID=UPI003D34A76C
MINKTPAAASSLVAIDTAAALRDAGLRVTDSRRVVLEALGRMPHSGADSVFAEASKSLPHTSRQAVYNVLGDLVTAGLARRIEPAGQPGLFELRVGDNHHHVICTKCGTVADVDCATGHAPCLTPSDGKGFAIVEAEVTFWGLCGTCRQSSNPVSPSSESIQQEQ